MCSGLDFAIDLKNEPMKFFRISFCLFFAGLAGLALYGQDVQAGLSSSYLFHPREGEAVFATGVRGQLWASWPVTPRNRLRASIGYRRLGGFDRLRVQSEETIQADEIYRTTIATWLTSLHHLEGTLAWNFRPKVDSRWSYELGVYYAHLVGWEGASDGATTISDMAQPGEAYNFILLDPPYSIRDELRTTDFGLGLGITRRLFEGLAIRVDLYRGLPDLIRGSFFQDSPHDHLAAISIGFSARLL